MNESERLISIAPLPAGWRAVYPLNPEGDLDGLRDEDLVYVAPVAALAHVEVWLGRRPGQDPPERWDDNIDDFIRPVRVEEGRYFDWMAGDEIAVLGPGEAIEPWMREAARGRIKSERLKLEQRRVAAA